MSSGILSGNEILRQVALGRIEIDPFDASRINPVSVDVTLGNKVAIFEEYTWIEAYGKGPEDGSRTLPIGQRLIHDSRKPLTLKTYDIDPELGWVVHPNVPYLMHTHERVRTDHYVPILDGKSSVGRVFVSVHETAAFGDPGFDGQFTLEVTSSFPIRLFPGMRIGQIRFQTIVGNLTLYEGQYRGERSTGPVGSRIHVTGFTKP